MNLSIILVIVAFLVVVSITNLPVNPVDADKGHKGEIDVESWGVVDIHEESESADPSDRAAVDVETSLNLDLEEQGERPSIDREHSVTFGDGEHGKRPPPSD